MKSESQIENDKAMLKISEYCSVIQRTKEILITLRNERDSCRKELDDHRNKNHRLDQKLKVVEKDKQALLTEMEKLKGNMNDLTQGRMDKMRKLYEEKLRLETSLKKSHSEKKRCIELLNEMKGQLVGLKRKYEHEMAMTNVEKEKLQ